jgi:hypothetical protein
MRARSIDALKRGISAVALAALVGCGGRTIEFAEVEGSVTLNKKPLSGAIVRFYPTRPDNKEQLPASKGTTDSSGRYSLTHDDDKPGAAVGEGKVVVSWPSRDLRAAMGAPAPSAIIPVRYTVVTESPLTVVVKQGVPGTPQKIDLPLTD